MKQTKEWTIAEHLVLMVPCTSTAATGIRSGCYLAATTRFGRDDLFVGARDANKGGV